MPTTFKTLTDARLPVEFIHGLPPDDGGLNFDRSKNNCLIFDDLMLECCASQLVADYFSRGAHHRNVSIFLLTQNLFQKGKYSVTISRNASYVILFKSPRDLGQIRSFGSQFMRAATFVRAYRMATDKPNGYVLVDCTQRMKRSWCLRTNILNASRETIFVIRQDAL